MSGIGAITNSAVPQTLQDRAVSTTGTVTTPEAGEETTGRTTSKTTSPPAYQALPFQRLSLATMGLGTPLNAADFVALIADVESQIDAIVSKIRNARANSVAARATNALAQMVETANSLVTLTGEMQVLQDQIDADRIQITEAEASLTHWQTTSLVLAPQVEEAWTAYQAAEAAVAALDPAAPDYAVRVADRDVKAAAWSELRQQKEAADSQVQTAQQRLDSLSADKAAKQATLSADEQTYDGLQASFSVVFSSLVITVTAAHPYAAVEDRGSDLLREDRIDTINDIAAEFSARLSKLASDTALARQLQVESVTDDRVRLALAALVTGVADVLSSLIDLQSANQPQPNPGTVENPRLIITG